MQNTYAGESLCPVGSLGWLSPECTAALPIDTRDNREHARNWNNKKLISFVACLPSETTELNILCAVCFSSWVCNCQHSLGVEYFKLQHSHPLSNDCWWTQLLWCRHLHIVECSLKKAIPHYVPEAIFACVYRPSSEFQGQSACSYPPVVYWSEGFWEFRFTCEVHSSAWWVELLL